MAIHPTAVIEPGAEVPNSCEVGPFCLVGAQVVLGEKNILRSHVVIEGHTQIADENVFYPGVVIGGSPQDVGYKEEPTKVEIGSKNIFRENTTVHKGTTKQDLITAIGNECMFMAGSHVGHDCVVEDKVILVNNVLLGGHAYVGEGTVIGGNSAVQQFGKVGTGCFIGGGSSIEKDIPSYSTGYGNRIRWRGLNLIGLKRRGFAREHISAAMKFYDALRGKTGTYGRFLEEQDLSVYAENPIIKRIIKDIKASKNGIATMKD